MIIKYILIVWVMTFGTIVIIDNTPCIGQYSSAKKSVYDKCSRKVFSRLFIRNR